MLHDGTGGGDFGEEITALKILRWGYYWPTLFKDTHAFAQKCQIFQVNAKRERRPRFPLQPVMVQNPFEQWGLYIFGEINPNFISIFLLLLIICLNGLKQFL